LIFELYILKLAQDLQLTETLVNEIEQIEKKLFDKNVILTEQTPLPTPIVGRSSSTDKASTVLKDVDRYKSIWEKVIEEIKMHKPMLSEDIQTHARKSFYKNEIHLFLPEGLYFDRVNQNLNLINSIVAKFFGNTTKVICKILPKKQIAKPISSEETIEVTEKEPIVELTSNDEVYELTDEKEKPEEIVTTDIAINKLLENFNGRIVNRHEHS